jgi:hypothetical protein
MLVWGGAGASYFDTGGRYDPLANAWQPTSTIGAPPARTGHAAVWAGDSLLVWGGYNGTYLATGGRYCSCAAATWYRDADGDGRGDPSSTITACGPAPGYVEEATDCDDASASAWAAPGEVPILLLPDNATLLWNTPADPGSLTVLYDVLRSQTPSDFAGAAVCVMTNGATASATDPGLPPVGGSFFYLVRARNDCPFGLGPLGTRSDGTPREGRTCP